MKEHAAVTEPTLAFYEASGSQFVPTDIAVSPWNPHGQSGIALGGLAAHVIGQVPTPAAMHTARISIDIFGVVPRLPVEPRVRVIREGRRIQLVDAELLVDGRVQVRMTALRTRIADSPRTDHPLVHPLPDPARNQSKLPWVEIHTLAGGFRQIGPGAQWVKINASVVAGQPLAALERVAMTADFGSGAAPLVSPGIWTFANLDIAAHMTRLPRGEWMLIDVTSESGGNGTGIIHSRLGDVDGMFGHAHQTVFLDPR